MSEFSQPLSPPPVGVSVSVSVCVCVCVCVLHIPAWNGKTLNFPIFLFINWMIKYRWVHLNVYLFVNRRKGHRFSASVDRTSGLRTAMKTVVQCFCSCIKPSIPSPQILILAGDVWPAAEDDGKTDLGRTEDTFVTWKGVGCWGVTFQRNTIWSFSS